MGQVNEDGSEGEAESSGDSPEESSEDYGDGAYSKPEPKQQPSKIDEKQEVCPHSKLGNDIWFFYSGSYEQ